MSMNCAATQELLPWMLNHTLSEDELRQVETHLESCSDCRRELEETRRAWAVYDAHVPTEVLVDHAWGRPIDLPTELLEAHLAECQECAEELSLARQSRTAEELSSETPFAAAPARRQERAPVVTAPSRLRWLPLAASLIAAVAIAGWIATQTQLHDVRGQLAATQAAPAETELVIPQEVLLLSPVALTRSGDGETLSIAEPTLLQLPLVNFEPQDGPFRAELLDEDGVVLATYADLSTNSRDEVVVPALPDELGDTRLATVRLTPRDGEPVYYARR